jgi:signal transduction histidine kinase
MTESIELSYNQNVMTFEFSALNYILPEKNQYSYIMEGFDCGWINAGSARSVTYTNLDPGKYTFRVRGSNNDGLWNHEGTLIKLYISPPPWQSWYAYLAYVGLFFAGIFLFVRYRIKSATRELETQTRIERAKLEEREEVRKKSSADFHDEAGNKLTKINLFTELAKSEAENNPLLKEYLAKIEENTKELSSGMRDFIWVLDPAKDSLYDTINRLKDFGNSMFDYTEIRFQVSGLTPGMKNIILPMEVRRALMLIFKEAMNNCLKYSEANCVEMNVSAENKFLKLSFKDDGKGFNMEEESIGYGLNNMRERAGKINCSIEISSEVNKGTIITLKGNIPHMGN